MHHFNALRNLNKTSEFRFETLRSQLQRKQAPVCEECHKKITHGYYSGLKLTQVFDSYLAKL
jgi:hypothetical protein